MNIGSKLKTERMKKGWAQIFVGKKLNIPSSTLSGYENDHRSPDLETLKQFATLYEVSTDYLLGLETSSLPKEPESKPINLELDLKNALEFEKVSWNGEPLTLKQKQLALDLLTAVEKHEHNDDN